MYYISTRGGSEKKTSARVIKQGLAEDGGLFVPERIPTVSKDFIKKLAEEDYAHRAADVLSLYLTDYTYDELLSAATDAYKEESFGKYAAPVKSLDKTHKVLELWHGPTCAFKDMALQIMPRLLSTALKKTGEKRTALILVATSGDTGKAALEGYKDVDGVKIMVFYPEDGVSDIQKLQMASQEGENVNVCAIKGNFDDAQTGVKQIFSDTNIAKELDEKGYFLSSANSINWGRLAPQIVYYFSAYCDLMNAGDITLGDEIDVCVPTGNFGNIFAAYLAKRMGLPVRRFICASNVNNVLTDFINTGIYDRNRQFHTTISPSMDILISSNLERLLWLIQGEEKTAEFMKLLKETGKYEVSAEVREKIASEFIGCFASEDETKQTIAETFEKHSYLIDTHTAVALFAAKKNATDIPVVTASTASPYKFAADVLSALTGNRDNGNDFFRILRELNAKTGAAVPRPLAALENKTRRFTTSVGKSKDEMFAEVAKFAD